MSMNNGDPPKPDAETGTPPLNKEVKEATRKIIRVLTVLAYLSSVSMAAIMLSLYYIFIWNPPPPPPSAQAMPEPISFLVLSTTDQTMPEHLSNRTWDGPEEPRALPVQLAQPNSRNDDSAQLHSDDVAATWESQEAFNIFRKRSIRENSRKLKLRNAAATLINT